MASEPHGPGAVDASGGRRAACRWRLRPWNAYWALVGALVAAHAVHAATGLGDPLLRSFFDDWVYTALYASAVPALLHRMRRAPEERWIWGLLAAGTTLYSSGS